MSGYKKTNPRSKKGFKRYCDYLYQRAVKIRDDFRCQKCKKKYPKVSRGLNAHHIKTKGSKNSFRYDLSNGLSLCVYHHRKYAHAERYEFERWLIDRNGQEWWDDLTFRSNQVRKIDYELTAKILEDVIEEMENENE